VVGEKGELYGVSTGFKGSKEEVVDGAAEAVVEKY
jgi:hypothetical protein